MKNKQTLFIFGFALIIRISYLVFFVQETEDLYFPDSMTYIELAKMIAAGETGSQRYKELDSERVPFYPLFVASVYRLLGENNWYVVILQLLLDCLTCLVIAKTASLIHKKLYLVAGILAGINLNIIVHGAIIGTDTFFLFPYSLLLLFLTKYLKYGHRTDLALMGLFFAVSLLTRSVLLYALPVLIYALVHKEFFHKKINLYALTSKMILFLAVVLIVVLPRFIQNKMNYGHISLVSQTGTHALNWVVPLAKEQSMGLTFESAQKETIQNYNQYLLGTGQKEPEKLFEKSDLQQKYAIIELRNLGFYNLIKAWVLGSLTNTFVPSSHAVPAVAKMERPSFYSTQGNSFTEKLFNYLGNVNSIAYLGIIFVSLGTTVVFFMLSCFGIITCFVKKYEISDVFVSNAVLVYLLFIGYFYFVTGPVIGVKYRLPIEPFMMIFAAIGMRVLFNIMKKTRQALCVE